MFHYLYKTTCLVNDKYYIGVHSTKNLFDGYLGSGTLLRLSIEKHGAFNHDRVWLEFFDTREEAFARESEVVTEELIRLDSLCMNLKPGGSGGWGTSEDQSKRGIRGNATMKYLREIDLEWQEKFSQTMSNALRLSYENGTRISTFHGALQAEMRRRAALPEAKAKRKETFQNIKHQQGEKNSQYGTCWVSNSVHTIKISVELLEEYLSQGYIRGRKFIV
jgi:hypothetical protein